MQMRRYGRSALSHAPVLFANSFPKSGTHLLTQIMHGFTDLGPAVNSGLPAVVTYEGDTGRQRPESEILADIQRLLPGDIAYGHVHALPGAVKVLSESRFASYFILRDPRDVAVSHVHYVTDMETRHIHHRYYTLALPDFDARLSASIAGLSKTEFAASGLILPAILDPKEEELLPDIRARFAPFMGWLDAAEILTLRYEDLMTQRQEMLAKILEHALAHGFIIKTSREEALQILQASIAPKNSPTFRSGKIGGWQAAFKPQHKTLFKQVSGDLLQRLGYETGYDW